MAKTKSQTKKLHVSPHLKKAASLMSDSSNMFASGGLFH